VEKFKEHVRATLSANRLYVRTHFAVLLIPDDGFSVKSKPPTFMQSRRFIYFSKVTDFHNR